MSAAASVGNAADDTTPAERESSGPMEDFHYDDGIVRWFAFATIGWGLVGMFVGLTVAMLLVLPKMMGSPELEPYAPMLSFGRLRPVHTNAMIFAFAGNAIFTAVYYSLPRLLKTAMYSPVLGRLHFLTWQAIVVAAGISLPLGMMQGKVYAELEWPIDIAIAVVWFGLFGGNVLMTLLSRRARYLYVAIWFYLGTIVAFSILHIFNNVVFPIGFFNSYPLYSGVQDAFVQGWYTNNLLGFFFIVPFLGMMYYFLPKAAERPLYSYKLSIVHFWSLVLLYGLSSARYLHYTTLPEWVSSFGMIFALMLWMPSWGGLINGWLTMRGAWRSVISDPVLKFFVVALFFYGLVTIESTILSIKAVNALTHFTDWPIAHAHVMAMGWVGFMTFGMLYWLAPRIFQNKLCSPWMAEGHFWIALAGVLLYTVPIYIAGAKQSAMWRALNDTGQLAYPNFMDTLELLAPLYWMRVGGGLLYLLGACLLALNYALTWITRRGRYEVPVYSASALSPHFVEPDPVTSTIEPVLDVGRKVDFWTTLRWHRRLEGRPVRMIVWITVVVVLGSLFQMPPLFLAPHSGPTIANAVPYTPLELAGQDIYISEGCSNCHSQLVRPLLSDTKRYGEYSKPGEFHYDRPVQWGSRRLGPDLAREGGKQSDVWHLMHFGNPQAAVLGSIMPNYTSLLTEDIDFESIQPRVAAAAALGVPYDRELTEAEQMARDQAMQVNQSIVDQGGNGIYADKKLVALLAYLQRLGVDQSAATPEEQEENISQYSARETTTATEEPTVVKAETEDHE